MGWVIYRRANGMFYFILLHCFQTHTIRYCNMDYIILSSLANVKLLQVVIMHNIGCQWSKNFWCRMEEFSDDLKLDPTSVKVGISMCMVTIAKFFVLLIWMVSVGPVGRRWKPPGLKQNVLGTSTHEMGPGACHETLNDQWSSWNFWKVVGFHKFHAIVIETMVSD